MQPPISLLNTFLLQQPDTNREKSANHPEMLTLHAAKDTNYKRALTPALQELVEACFTLQTTSTKVLAAYLQRSPAAIRSDFQRIRIILGMHSKHTFKPAAVKLATAAFIKNSK